MKKICILVAGLMAGSLATNAQTVYDANHLMGTDLGGTARFIGMGGAMGALGGDISTTSTNPAGIGLFRSNDAMISFGLQNTSSKAEFDRYSNSKDKTIPTIDNMGFVFANHSNGDGALKFVNFALNYRRYKSFNREMLGYGTYRNTLTQQIANMANNAGQYPTDLQADGVFVNNTSASWLSVLGWNSWLLPPNYKTETNGTQTFTGYSPYYSSFNNGEYVNSTYYTKERGGIDNFDMNMAFNFNDRFYLGATIGIYDVNYHRDSQYTEAFFANGTDTKDDGNYTLNNYYKLTGSGVDFKLGVIIRPVESSPFRFGFAVHTPTYYTLTENQYSELNFNVFDGKTNKTGVSKPYDSNNNDMESETKYRILTPWKFNANIGFTVDKYAAIGAEYEYADYSAAKLKDNDDNDMEYENGTIGQMLKGVHTLRIGAEFKVLPELSLRLGYNYISPSTKDNAQKLLANNAVRTDAEYYNTKDINNISCGLGFRAGSFYCDMAYIYSRQTADFYPFNPNNNSNQNNVLAASKITDTRNRVVFTLGYRF